MEEGKADKNDRLQLNRLIADADSDDEMQRQKELENEEFLMMNEEEK
jgi:hypothetical protein